MMVCSRYYPNTCLDGLRNDTKNHNFNCRIPYRGSNLNSKKFYMRMPVSQTESSVLCFQIEFIAWKSTTKCTKKLKLSLQNSFSALDGIKWIALLWPLTSVRYKAKCTSQSVAGKNIPSICQKLNFYALQKLRLQTHNSLLLPTWYTNFLFIHTMYRNLILCKLCEWTRN